MKKMKRPGIMLLLALSALVLSVALLISGPVPQAYAANQELLIDSDYDMDLFYQDLQYEISTLNANEELLVKFDLPADSRLSMPSPGSAIPVERNAAITFNSFNGPLTLVNAQDERHLIFEIYPDVTLTLDFANQITLDGEGQSDLANYVSRGGGISVTGSDGQLELQNAHIQNCCQASSMSGGALKASGALSLRGSTLQHNSVYLLGNGGGIHAAGQATIEDSFLLYNSSPYGSGGGLYGSNDVRVISSIFRGNLSQAQAGGLWGMGNITITANSKFEYNQVQSFGGALLGYGNITIQDSRFAYNEAHTLGGAIYIANVDSTMLLSNSSLIGNEASALPSHSQTAHGGAIAWWGDSTQLSNFIIEDCTFTENRADVGYEIDSTTSADLPFSGWDFTSASDPFTHIANNYDIYYSPSWSGSDTSPIYTLTFYQNDDTAEQYYACVKLGDLPAGFPSAPARDGFYFTGWNTEADGSGMDIAADTSLPGTSNLTVYAQWEELVLPGKPQNFTAAPMDKEVVLSWAAPANVGSSAIIRYEVNCSGDGWQDAGLSLSYTYDNLINGENYNFDVRAVNDQGAGEAASASATPRGVPNAPQSLTVTAGNRQASLSWEIPTSDGGSPVTEYEITVIATGTNLNYTTDATSYLVTGLTNGIAYTFQVRAVNALGVGEEISVTATPRSSGSGSSSSTTVYSVYFETNGGTAVSRQSIASNAKVTKPTDPKREGYTFTGWYTEAALMNLYDFDHAVTAGFTLYAGWEVTETVNYEYMHGAYIHGYGDGTFKPEASLSRAEAGNLFYNLLDNEAAAGSYAVDFSDVAAGAWYYEAVMELVQRGIISGYMDGTFKANQTITRAEFTAMTLRFAGIEAANVASSFNDVSIDNWASKIIAAAVDEGYINGYENGTFSPDNSVTRAEAVTILNRVIGCEGISEGTSFRDVLDDYWAHDAITAAATRHNH